MINNISIWYFISERLNKSKPVILLCVLESRGSSPGRQGFKMAVAEDGLQGSIGGGIMEHKFVEMAKEKLASILKEPIVRKQIHNKSAAQNQSGMICSGEQTIVLYHLTANNLDTVQRIISCLENDRNGHMRILPGEFYFSEEKNDKEYFFEMKSEEEWTYQEQLGYKNHLYIVGGGHCAFAFSKIMAPMDFCIHLFEERKGLNTYDNNSFVNEKMIVSDYSDLKIQIPSGKNNYVVIMTFGYRTDDIALRSLIVNDYKYLGVLGSESKMKKMFEEWRKDGLPEERLNKIHAPIGVNISSHSPEEIAISIAAEIIGVKNRKIN